MKMNNINLLFSLVVIIYSSSTIGAMARLKLQQVASLNTSLPTSPPHSSVLKVSSIGELLDTISILVHKKRSSSGDDDEPVSVGMGGLEYEFYRHDCPRTEAIIRAFMARAYKQHKNLPASLLRLFFHDCFIKGCDASVLLNDKSGNTERQIEREASPNLSLKGFAIIETIKEELEKACPGVVSCADIISIATRDGIALSGGPFYPLLTGRRDSPNSYFYEANAEIPKPNSSISETLRLFSSRGFNPRETVALLGGHGIGKISCDFIQERINDFQGTHRPDPRIAPDFLQELRLECSRKSPDGGSPSVISKGKLDSQYYKNLARGRGVLISDQELMNNPITTQVVALYASDDGTLFRKDFARSMLKLSHLNVLTGTQGHVRLTCSQLPPGFPPRNAVGSNMRIGLGG